MENCNVCRWLVNTSSLLLGWKSARFTRGVNLARACDANPASFISNTNTAINKSSQTESQVVTHHKIGCLGFHPPVSSGNLFKNCRVWYLRIREHHKHDACSSIHCLNIDQNVSLSKIKPSGRKGSKQHKLKIRLLNRAYIVASYPPFYVDSSNTISTFESPRILAENSVSSQEVINLWLKIE